MTDRTILRIAVLCRPAREASVNKPGAWGHWNLRYRIRMSFVGKEHAKLRNKALALWRIKKQSANAGKRMPSRVSRRRDSMTVQTYARRRAFPREKLLAMTIQTSAMLRILSDVFERLLAYFLPVRAGKFMTRIATKLLLIDVRRVQKVCVVDRASLNSTLSHYEIVWYTCQKS